MITFKPILIFGILVPFWAAVGAENVTDVFNHPTEGLAASPLMSEQEHKIDWKLNPGCPLPVVDETRLGLNCTPGTLPSNLATTVAAIKIVAPKAPPSALTNETTDQDDKILTNSWVWSMVNGSSPALMVSMVDPDDDVDVNWFHIVGGKSAFKYKVMPKFSAAVMITKLLEFDDPKNRGVYDGRSEVIEYPMKKLTWKREVIDNTSVVAISFVSSLAPSNGSQSRDGASLTGGIIKITLAAYANGGFGKWLPHLSHSHKTNQFDIELQNVTTNSGFNFSRFGIEMVLVASLNSSIKDERRIRHTNDDEHTPGTFEYDELVVVNDDDNDLQPYMQWKPIVYCSDERGKLSTNAHMSYSTNVTSTTDLQGTMLDSFYGDQLNAMLIRRINVTFGKAGKQGDTSGYYSKNPFHAWTFTFGTGAPIEPGWSPKFVIAASVTLLVVVLACAGGAAACCYRKYTRSRSLNISSNSNPYSRLGGAGS